MSPFPLSAGSKNLWRAILDAHRKYTRGVFRKSVLGQEIGVGSLQVEPCKAHVFLGECSRPPCWMHSVDTVLKNILSCLSLGCVIPQRFYRWDNLLKNFIQRQVLTLLCPNSWDKNMTYVLVLRIKKYSITISDHKVTLIAVHGILLPFFLLNWFNSKEIEKKANCLLRLGSFPAETASSPACLTNVLSVQSHWAPLSGKTPSWFNALLLPSWNS